MGIVLRQSFTSNYNQVSIADATEKTKVELIVTVLWLSSVVYRIIFFVISASLKKRCRKMLPLQHGGKGLAQPRFTRVVQDNASREARNSNNGSGNV